MSRPSDCFRYSTGYIKYIEIFRLHLTPFIQHLHQIVIDDYQIDNYIVLKDTNHLLIEIENINKEFIDKNLSMKNEILITGDITSLYTNIDQVGNIYNLRSNMHDSKRPFTEIVQKYEVIKRENICAMYTVVYHRARLYLVVHGFATVQFIEQ